MGNGLFKSSKDQNRDEAPIIADKKARKAAKKAKKEQVFQENLKNYGL